MEEIQPELARRGVPAANGRVTGCTKGTKEGAAAAATMKKKASRTKTSCCRGGANAIDHFSNRLVVIGRRKIGAKE